MAHRISDMTPVVNPFHHPGSGPLRQRHPIYVELHAPCQHACQAGEDMRGWLGFAQRGEYEQAWRYLVEVNPFPAIHGRVCYHPCETACNRQALDETVSIHAIERFLGDLAISEGWALPAASTTTGKRVLVVGAGPAGLSAAYHLWRLGHQVEIHEAANVAGGMMVFGIPAYRLPRDVLEAEIERLQSAGIRLVLNARVDDVLQAKAAGNFDAVFVGIGAQLAKKSDIPATDAVRVMDALGLLKDADRAGKPLLGRKVVVYGGGNTAMDSARTAKRLGAYDTTIVYRRDRAHMPAHAFEIDEALAEGVQIRWLAAIHDVGSHALEVERITLDEHGRPHATGEFEQVPTDALVLAIGQEADTAFLKKIPGVEFDADGLLSVDTQWMTGYEGVFAGGDMVTREHTVTNAVGLGRKAAYGIHTWLAQQTLQPVPIPRRVTLDMLHLPVFNDAPVLPQPKRDASSRAQDFGEIIGGFSPEQARYEAQRCLSCGKCYECDNCFAACPQKAIIKLGKGKHYQIDLDRCTGCAVCFDQCPCHAIEMQTEITLIHDENDKITP